MRKILLIFAMCFALTGSALAQLSVNVTVIDAGDGAGIPGVTVIEKGTNNGTVTNIDGNYTLNVSSGDAATFLIES